MHLLLEAIQLAKTLATKSTLNDDEFGVYCSLNSYIELQVRAATKVLEKELLDEGLIDGDSTGVTPAWR